MSEDAQMRTDDILMRNFAVKLIFLLRCVRRNLWNRQCIIAFSQTESLAELDCLMNESFNTFAAAVTEIRNTLSHERFINNIVLLRQDATVLRMILLQFRTAILYLKTGVQFSSFVYEQWEIHDGKRKTQATKRRKAKISSLMNKSVFIDTLQIVLAMREILTQRVRNEIVAATEELICNTDTCIRNAETELQSFTDRFSKREKTPIVKLASGERSFKSCLTSATSQRQGKKVKIGQVVCRDVTKNDVIFESVSEHQEHKKQEQTFDPFSALRRQSKPAVEKCEELEELTKHFPNPKTLIRLTTPPKCTNKKRNRL